MVNIVVDGVKYVPENTVSKVELEQNCGSKVSAIVEGYHLEVKIDDSTVAIWNKGQEVFLFGADKWANQRIRGEANTTTRATLKQMAESVGLIGDDVGYKGAIPASFGNWVIKTVGDEMVITNNNQPNGVVYKFCDGSIGWVRRKPNRSDTYETLFSSDRMDEEDG